MVGTLTINNLYPSNLLPNCPNLLEDLTQICSLVQQTLLRDLLRVLVQAVADSQARKGLQGEEALALMIFTIVARSFLQRQIRLSSRSNLLSVVILMLSAPSSSLVVAAHLNQRSALLETMVP